MLQLSCLDASLAVRPVFSKFQTVVITSGTLSPIDLYPRILNFNPVAIQSFAMTLTRCLLAPRLSRQPAASCFLCPLLRVLDSLHALNLGVPRLWASTPENACARRTVSRHHVTARLAAGGQDGFDVRRDCMCPVVLTRGSDQMPVSTKFEMRDDDNVIRNYGRMLIELAAAIPDGLVCFFVSYSYMDKIVSKWHDMGVLTVKHPPPWLLMMPSFRLVVGWHSWDLCISW